jgi:hypothetical protein
MAVQGPIPVEFAQVFPAWGVRGWPARECAGLWRPNTEPVAGRLGGPRAAVECEPAEHALQTMAVFGDHIVYLDLRLVTPYGAQSRATA